MFNIFSRSLIRKHAPEISGEAWFNKSAMPEEMRARVEVGKNVRIEDVAGRVILIDFWGYSYPACLNSMECVRGLWKKYEPSGFFIIGVHCPRFGFSSDSDNVQNAVLRLRLNHPVVNDPEYLTWDRYKTKKLPRKLLVGKDGKIAYDFRGEEDFCADITAGVEELLAK